MELINIIPGRLSGIAVLRDTSPDLILHDKHTNLFQLIAQLLDVIAHQAILNIHIGSMVEHIKRTFDIDFQRSRNMTCFLFILFQQGIVQVLQNRHIFRFRVIKIQLINLMDTSVNNCLFHRL